MQIKQIVQLSIVSATLFALAGCTSSKEYAAAIHSWRGAPETALVHAWGKPTEESYLKNGHRMVTYRVVDKNELTRKIYAPVVSTGRLSPQNKNGVLSHTPSVMAHRPETFWCETQFEINEAGVIVNTDFTGNNCVTTESGAKRRAFVR